MSTLCTEYLRLPSPQLPLSPDFLRGSSPRLMLSILVFQLDNILHDSYCVCPPPPGTIPPFLCIVPLVSVLVPSGEAIID